MILYAGSSGSIRTRIKSHDKIDKETGLPNKRFKYVLWCWMEESPFTINDILILETGLYSFISSLASVESGSYEKENAKNPMERRCSLLAGMKFNGVQCLKIISLFNQYLNEYLIEQPNAPAPTFDESLIFHAMTERDYPIDRSSSRIKQLRQKLRELSTLPSYEGTYDQLTRYGQLRVRYPIACFLSGFLMFLLTVSSLLNAAYYL